MSDEASPAALAVLVISDRDRGDGPTLQRVVPAFGVTVGAAPDCMISLGQTREPLAAHHARIAQDETGLFVLPEPGAPTFINGADQPLPANVRRPIRVGDTLRMGSALLRVQAPEAALPNFGPLSSLPGRADADQGRGTSEPDMLAGMLDDWGLGAAPAAPPPANPATSDALTTIVSDLRTVGVPPPPPNPPPSSPPSPRPPAPEPLPPAGEHASFSTGPDAAQAVLRALSQQTAPEPPGPEPTVPSPAIPDPPPAFRDAEPRDGGGHQVESWLPTRPMPSADASLAALAAFWWSLGCQPSVKDPAGLCQLMAELGAALRELVAGLENRLEPAARTGDGSFAPGQGGLRRFIAGGGKGPDANGDLSVWVRESFGQLDRQQQHGMDEVLAAVHGLVASLGADAVEQRLRPLVQSRLTRSQKAELWDLFCKTSDDIGHTAELRFQRDMLRRRTAGPSSAERTARA